LEEGDLAKLEIELKKKQKKRQKIEERNNRVQNVRAING
jgi:hypothetical protein